MVELSFLVVFSLTFLLFSTWVFAQKVIVDAQRHIHYVIYDFNSNLCSNPANELQLISQLSIDTVIDVVCDGASTAQNIVSAMVPYGLHLWSTVPWGSLYTGNDPGWVNELGNVPNVTGYFLTMNQTSSEVLHGT
jgi:hypothetical protein